MSNNQGKDGEMIFGVIVSSIGHSEDGFDYTRHSVTNSADLGSDFVIHSRDTTFEKIDQIAQGTYQPQQTAITSEHSPVSPSQGRRVATRVDCKTSPQITLSTVKKFCGDILKNPTMTNHVLAGGDRMMPAAAKEWQQQVDAHSVDGINLYYWSNQSIFNLSNHYEPPRPVAPPQTSDLLPPPSDSQEK
ncbi:hypothetical protein QUC30_11820 [Aeromonas caviae]|uniref:hypothetical protein n=1 Tax=Aeromonas caviae TaxID=648 RepID=UPI003A35588C